jgi:predicted  nucleic acid-binding Zn-ribbon protein
MSVERCPNCGTPYQEGASFCINCGMNKEEAAKAAEPAEEPDESGFAPPVREDGEVPSEEASADDEPETRPEPAPEPELETEAEPAPETLKAPELPPEADDKLDETAARLEAEIRPEDEIEFKPSKKGRGCCLAIVIAGIIGFIVLAVIVAALVIFGVIGGGGTGVREGGVYTYDFADMKDADFEIWSRGDGSVVENENEMVKLKDALLGLERDFGSDYGVEVTVYFVSVEKKSAWAGPVLRVNPGGGDRYAFELMPDADKAALKRNGDTLGEKTVNLEVGKPYLVYAEAVGNDLGLAVNDTPVVKASDIGLIAGGIGLEARGCTAYFDDLEVKVLK